MNVTYELDGANLVARVGVSGPPVASGKAYAIYLELGTRRMAPRPYIRTTMWEQATEITRILEGRRHSSIVIPSQAGVNLPGSTGPLSAQYAIDVNLLPPS